MKIRWVIGAAVLAGVVGVFGPAVAASAAGSFANGTFNCSQGGSTCSSPFTTLYRGDTTSIAPWTVTQNSVDWINGYWLPPPGGGYSVDMNGSGYPANGQIAQTFATTAGATYFVSFELSGNFNTACTLPTAGSQTVYVVAPGTTPTDTIANVPNLGTPFTFLESSVSGGYGYLTNMGWTTKGYTFTAASSTTSSTLTFTADPTNTSNCGPVIANVSVTQVAASGAQCKDGGWQMGIVVNNEVVTFTNQGQCVSYFATSGDTPIGS